MSGRRPHDSAIPPLRGLERSSLARTTNYVMFQQGPMARNLILLENGSPILLENGTNLLLGN